MPHAPDIVKFVYCNQYFSRSQKTFIKTNEKTLSFQPRSPSFSNLETFTRNLDMQELDYNPSKKDLTDARIHHLLAEELKPYRRVSISRSDYQILSFF